VPPPGEVRAERLAELALQIDDAWANATTVPSPTSTEPALTRDDAYAIQESVISSRLDGTRTRAGWKLGLTTSPPPVTPIVGSLLSDMVVPSPAELSLPRMVAPMVEAELVVCIGETIDGPRTLADLTDGPHQVAPGLEVIDYRTCGETGVVDWIADNSTVAYAVVGDPVPVADVDPASIEVTLSEHGKTLAEGRGGLIMGNPLAAVVWLSEHLAERGHTLERGHIVLTGSLTGHHNVPAERPSTFRARFGSLGDVKVSFRP
jgi:2-keto-4-pentenoate hydratase